MPSPAASPPATGRQRPVKELPAGYRVKRVFDFSKGVWFWVLNILGIPAAVAVGWLFLLLAGALRSQHPAEVLATSRLGLSWPLAVALIVLVLVVHELIHGIGFWWFTRSRPKFGFKGYAAYAGAPDWYLPRSQHMVVGLAPFVVITAIGLVLLALVPSSLVHLVLLPAALNAMGGIADLAVALYELLQPPNALVNDTGMVISVYEAG